MDEISSKDSTGRRPSPKDFLRTRRPEQFSDTVVSERPQLDRTTLEYHLDTLTNRGQENDFEEFSRRLAEFEICPNLLPHTGPTGGGDSKVDSETYPVADALADAWYTGIGRDAAHERWAFAISAKKEWRPKVQSDVAKIVGTGRGYTTVFFFSSRYIPDKARAEVEDTLAQKYQVKVHIFDRTWLLNKVFQNKHEALAIETLRMHVAPTSQTLLGPKDMQRAQEMAILQDRIHKSISQQQYSIALVDDCLEVAILSRKLERPVDETSGLFVRANRLATKFGTEQQRITTYYEYAWTAYWWHEDLDLFEELYDKMEAAVANSQNGFDVERLQNLWSLYRTAVHHGDIKATPEQLEAKTSVLRLELMRLSNEVHRPSTSLQARSQLLMLDLIMSIHNNDNIGVGPLLEQIQEVVLESGSLVGFALEPLVEMVSSIGPIFLDLPAYDELFNQLVEGSAARKSEVVAARLLVARAVQQGDGGRPVEAIKTLGKALGKLYKHESREDLVMALALCGVVYTDVGLYWAARNSTLFSASIATDEYYRYGVTNAAQVTCFNRLSWRELQLGRISFALAWYEVYLTIGRILLAKQEYNPEKFEQQCHEFDMVLGMLLLKTKTKDLSALSPIPAILDHLGLYNSSLAALFVLGYEEEIIKQEPFSEQPERLFDFFKKWLELHVEGQLPESPAYCESETIHLSSIVMGCRVKVEVVNELPLLLLAESILAGFEGLLATSINTSLVLKEPQLTIRISRDLQEVKLFKYDMSEADGRPHIVVRCGTLDTKLSSIYSQSELKELIGDLLLTMLACVIMPNDFQAQLTILLRDELASSRAVNFNSSFIFFTNLLGDVPKYKLADWPLIAESLRPSLRAESWYDSLAPRVRQAPLLNEGTESRAQPKQTIKHDEIEINSLIRDPLWKRAKWIGAGFLRSQQVPCPALCLLFTDKDAAVKIFELWRQELTSHDKNDRLRITLVRQINKKNPLAYRLVVGANFDNFDTLAPGKGEISENHIGAYKISTYRMHTIDNPSANHVDPFKQDFERYNAYILIPGVISDPTAQPQFYHELGILKHKISIRDAWNIGPNDLDSIGIMVDDEPIIPVGIEEPPVYELQKIKRSRKES
jgi:hypothetical protein